MLQDRILKIAKIGNPVLRREAQEVKDISSEEIRNIIRDMKTTFNDYKLDAVGLAAPQVNISLKIIIIQVPKIENEKFEGFPMTVLINPEWKPLSEKKIYDFEGCLSICDYQGIVPRYKEISFSYQNENGDLIQGEAHGYLARVLQHECDHLIGKLYIDRIEDLSSFGLTEEIKKMFASEIMK